MWLASVRNGIPAYFVQDIETSYYPDRPDFAYRVVDTYRHEFRYLTISEWNRERLAEYGVPARLVPPGVNLDEFREREDVARHARRLLVIGRDNPLKNLALTMAAYELLGPDRPEMQMFGVEPQVGERYGVPYANSPPDDGVVELFNEAAVFVQTSVHEGFCLPPLEAMATGCAVVCTDAHGNRDFCRDGENCLMPDGDARGGGGGHPPPARRRRAARAPGGRGPAHRRRLRVGQAHRRARGRPGGHKPDDSGGHRRRARMKRAVPHRCAGFRGRGNPRLALRALA